MTIIDKLEKVGRFILWLTLSACCALVPLSAYGYSKVVASTAADQARAREAERREDKAEKEKDAAARVARLPLASMGDAMHLLSGSIGHVWLSNATPRHGFVCVAGEAKSAKGSTTSLISCVEVQPFATGIELKMMFAGASLKELCPQNDCELSVKEAP